MDRSKNWLRLLYCTNKKVIKVWHILENFPIQVDIIDVIAPEHVLFVWVCFFVQFYSEADAREGKVSQNGSVVWRLSDFSALCLCHSCRSVSVWWAELSNSTRIHRHTPPPHQKSSCSRHSTQDKIGDLFVPQSNRTRQRGAFPAELCGDVGVFFFYFLFVLYNRHFWIKLL